MRAQDLMTHPPVTCHVNDLLNLAAHLMWDHDCGALMVVNDDGELTGVITDRDVCMAAFTQGRPLDEILVNSAMSKHVVSAGPDLPIAEIEELMASHRIRRIPIVDAGRKPIGMVSLNDIAIEAVQPDTQMKQGTAKVAHTLAAICKHGHSAHRAA